MVGKPEEVDIKCSCVVRSFWNCSTREATMGLEDNVGPDPNRSVGGTTVVALNYRDL